MSSVKDLHNLYRLISQHPPHDPEFVIGTMSNPGWYVSATLGDAVAKFSNYGDSDVDQDWRFCTVRGERFYGHGGPRNLKGILGELAQAVGFEWGARDGGLALLEEWYATRCDGEWEHGGGVRFRASSIGGELILDLNQGYWPEPIYPVPGNAIFAQSARQVRVEGTVEEIEEFVNSLRPLNGSPRNQE